MFNFLKKHNWVITKYKTYGCSVVTLPEYTCTKCGTKSMLDDWQLPKRGCKGSK